MGKLAPGQKDTVVSRWLLAPLGFVVGVTLCGCASAHAHSDGSVKPASLVELRWIGKLDREYQPSENFAESCPISHLTGLGKPPTHRLRHYIATARAACRMFEGAGSNSGSSPSTTDSGDALALMQRANEILEPLRPGMRRLPHVAGPSGRSRIASRYTPVAAAIAGDGDTVVRCWSISDWNRLTARAAAYWGSKGAPDLLGFVIKPHWINLSPSACRSLDEFTYERARPDDRSGLDALAVGLITLAHESEHIRHPFAGEAVIECYGMQSISGVARLLGGPERYGEQIARAELRDVYPEAPSAYRTAACHDGGPLDLRPARPRWP